MESGRGEKKRKIQFTEIGNISGINSNMAGNTKQETGNGKQETGNRKHEIQNASGF